MPKHARKSAQDQIALNPIVGLLIAVLAIGAVVLGVIKVTSPSPSGGGSSAQETAAGEAANGQSAANVSTKEGDDTTTATTGNQSGEQKKDDKKSNESTSDSKDSKDDKSGSGDSKTSSDKDDKNADKTEGGSSSSNSGASAESGDAGGSASGSAQGDSGVYGDTTPVIVVAPNAEGWYTGEACATCVEESGTITASEIPFDDSVPQIGLDTGFPNYAAHLGGYAEVKYEGKTVKAQVVDAGAYNGGPAGIALNPGVFEQFGVSSVYDWGRRNVTYRFV